MNQLPLDMFLLHPVIVPTPDVNFVGEYQELDPVEWNGQLWNVLDWDFEHNAFVLLNDEDWDVLILNHEKGEDDLRAAVLETVWEEE